MGLGKTIHHDKMDCPVCHTGLDASNAIGDEEDAKPEDGSITICLFCASMLEYSGNNLIKVDDEKAKTIIDDLSKEQLLAVLVVRKMVEERRSRN